VEIRQLRTFRTVAQLLSFNRAADRLHYAQSSISAQIHALEEELDVKLFDRMGRRIMLTEAGSRLLGYAEKMLDLADETRAEVAETKEPQGSLTIRIPETFGVYRLPPIIRQFRSRFPKVRLRLDTCAHDGLQKDLRRGITDLAFLLTESIQSSDMGVEALGVESILLVCHPDHALASRAQVRTRDLERETMLFSLVDCSYRRSFEKILEAEQVHIDNPLVFNSVAALKQCVIQGIGLSILPEVSVNKEIKKGRIKALPWEVDELEVAVLMLWYKDRWLSPTLRAFMEMTREGLGEAYGH
jgi:DNA-binding transcriptional LysR family regulator